MTDAIDLTNYRPGVPADEHVLHGVLVGNPWAKIRPRISAAVKGRRPRTHQDPADKQAENRTRAALIGLGWPMLTGNVWLRLFFVRGSRQVVDLDNLEKHFLDCGNSVLWVDDCQVTRKDSRLFLDKDNARTEFWVSNDPDADLIRDRSGEPYEKAQTQLTKWRSELSE